MRGRSRWHGRLTPSQIGYARDVARVRTDDFMREGYDRTKGDDRALTDREWLAPKHVVGAVGEVAFAVNRGLPFPDGEDPDPEGDFAGRWEVRSTTYDPGQLVVKCTDDRSLVYVLMIVRPQTGHYRLAGAERGRAVWDRGFDPFEVAPWTVQEGSPDQRRLHERDLRPLRAFLPDPRLADLGLGPLRGREASL